MAVAITLLLAVVAILLGKMHDLIVSVVTAQWMKLHEVFLHPVMTWLWQDVKLTSPMEKASLLPKLQSWPFCTAAAAILAEICWVAWQMHLASRSCPEQDSSSSEEEDDSEKEKDLKGQHPSVRMFSVYNVLPTQELSEMCRDVQKLVRDLLRICRVICKKTSMPEMYPATGKDGIHESWNVFEDRIMYLLVVFLQPPAGYSFRLELYGGMHLPERCCNIRVVLECTCSETGDMFCFLHPSDNNQSSPLLSTLCTGSYLDVEEIACWMQNLVGSAWESLPQWHDWELRVLPSSHSCRLLLTGPSEVQLCVVLMFAVQQGSPGTFLVLQ
ncbi:inositol 1,4,5-trisphosphate receptor-interacting protein-like 1 [Chiroxiphia lanceolata]|uniref:inositol 1,4,5-trisphosphate receptor-interacting protein-like 1 n=1 Tax=Chiroxiphia lanceolata TaxID=296741 RepID=UPI0013CEED46|nr:inositol 1,4,5-trisphosphate receptor-interacting protein-like 1 [Chiroxiphia lanceolata]XP_032541965.1 inositol 1,4,5-trisphosphate receptor-interacting protein-like 1 [Chiroxiphia lanceolata]XP_032541966.1 inositol 1,4,5-trisphosphate receptor-interacting protein-like 1 [Chiroxiphia lanceolata]